MEPEPLRPGGVVTYGFLRGLLSTLRTAQADRPWVYLDRGYFRASYGGDYSGYFRATRNRWQHSGAGEYDGERWARLGLQVKPWRARGEHILVCPPGDVFSKAVGQFSAVEWLTLVLKRLAKVTDRSVHVRYKSMSGERPLAADLVNCHALVTYMSNTATEALLEGVPVVCLGPSAAAEMGGTLETIENPKYPDDRERWARVLAANQWTLDEFKNGLANDEVFT